MGVLKTLARVPGARGILALSFLLGLAYSFVMPFLSVFGTREVGMSAFGFLGVFLGPALLALVYTLIEEWRAPEDRTVTS